MGSSQPLDAPLDARGVAASNLPSAKRCGRRGRRGRRVKTTPLSLPEGALANEARPVVPAGVSNSSTVVTAIISIATLR